MHRAALKHGITAAGKANTIRGWSVLSSRTTPVQRPLSNGPGSADSGGGEGKRTDKDDDAAAGGQQGVGGAARAGERTIQPNGRGRGAFSQFLRTHERKIGKQLRKIDEFPEDGRGGDSVSGQFDDSEDGSGKKSFSGSARDDGGLFEKSPPKMEDSRSSSQDDKWQEQWFSHEDKRIDRLGLEEGEDMGGDIPELDDCEEDDHFDAEEDWTDSVWTGYTPEQIEEFKVLGARLEEEESKQMADLRVRWKKTKVASEREHGTAEHLELPDIIIKHEMTYEAPQGEANADRPMPLPRSLAKIVDSMQLPSGLDVTPDDPEYEQVVNMWKSVSRNNTMDEVRL
ncbi:unnamed protein product, partial [Scytosiphon promiscuus]